MWPDGGLLEAELTASGTRPEFAPDQVDRVRLIQALLRKGMGLPQLAGRNLAFHHNERFVVYDVGGAVLKVVQQTG